MDLFSRGFVEILAAEQTPDSTAWFQGTADAVRKAQRHFIQHDASHYLILAGDHLYRMNYAELLAGARRSRRRRHDRRPAGRRRGSDRHGHLQLRSAGTHRRLRGEAQRRAAAADGAQPGPGAGFVAADPDKPYIASMGIYLFSRQVLLDLLAQEPGHDFGRELIPAALTRYKVRAFLIAATGRTSAPSRASTTPTSC